MRTIYFIRNALAGIAGKLLGQLLGFIVRTVFIHTLCQEFLGINGLFTSVLAFLNLSELGLGSAIVFALYEPLANDRRDKICALMNFYKKAYRIIGCATLILGICVLPFLDYIIKGDTGAINIYAVYLLFLTDTVFSYWFWAYKASLLIAAQKEYIAVGIRNRIDIVKSIVRIVFLILLRNVPIASFYTYTASGIIFTLIANYRINCRVEKEFPFLREDKCSAVSREDRKQIFQRIIGLSTYRISSVVNNAMDTIIISAMIGVGINGIYSNYTLLISMVNGVLWIVVTAIIPGIGNLYARNEMDRLYEVFKEICVLFFVGYGFCGIVLFTLINPFIGDMWLDYSYLLGRDVVIACFLNFTTGGILTPFSVLVEATGKFSKRGISSIVSVIINIILSVVLLQKCHMGIAGVLLATVVARMVVAVPVYLNIVAKDIFRRRVISFGVTYILALCVICVFAVVINIAISCISLSGFWGVIIKAIICVMLSAGGFAAILVWTSYFKPLKERIAMLLKKIK